MRQISTHIFFLKFKNVPILQKCLKRQCTTTVFYLAILCLDTTGKCQRPCRSLGSLTYVYPTRLSVNYHLRAPPRDPRRLSNPRLPSAKSAHSRAALRCPINACRKPTREIRHGERRDWRQSLINCQAERRVLVIIGLWLSAGSLINLNNRAAVFATGSAYARN